MTLINKRIIIISLFLFSSIIVNAWSLADFVSYLNGSVKEVIETTTYGDYEVFKVSEYSKEGFITSYKEYTNEGGRLIETRLYSYKFDNKGRIVEVKISFGGMQEYQPTDSEIQVTYEDGFYIIDDGEDWRGYTKRYTMNHVEYKNRVEDIEVGMADLIFKSTKSKNGVLVEEQLISSPDYDMSDFEYTTIKSYNNLGLLVSANHKEDNLSYMYTYLYDKNHNLIQVERMNNNITDVKTYEYAYDDNRNWISQKGTAYQQHLSLHYSDFSRNIDYDGQFVKERKIIYY